jgi:protein-L-isoaspartate O-methyltransferase
MTFTATYSPDDNKLRLYASARLDADTYARVKSAGFTWAPKQDLFVAPMWTPNRADLLMELAGDIGDEDTSLIDRAEDRADRFTDYHEHRTADAESARRTVATIADGIPFGQPILVGHHSERHARRDAERIEAGMRKAVRMWETAQYWRSRAAGAIRHAKYKELPSVRARRIKTIEADKRREERQIAKSRASLELWGKLEAPDKDGRPCDDALQLLRARHIANYYDHGYAERDHAHQSGYIGPLSFWDALKDDPPLKTPAEIRAIAERGHAAIIATCDRWIAHFDLRLEYERDMLDEQGASALLAPKTRPTQLPLCNYRAPNGIDIENMYNRGEIIHYPQVEMTKAEYARISADYKGTRVVGHSHRVRTTMQRHALVCIFLTDSGTHTPPPPQTPPKRTPRVPVRSDEAETTRSPSPAAAEIDAMRETLRAGVQVVTAPQLFPTPGDVARQVVDLADIQPGDRVLEPSAGTGALLTAINGRTSTCGVVLAVEINHHLADRLRAAFPLAVVYTADFLTWQPDAPVDRIVMNPPFRNAEDIKHIQHARRMLAPGGRLVAICANGPRQQDQLQPLATEWIDLPPATFAEAGTNVRVAIMVIDAGPLPEATEARDDHGFTLEPTP